MKSLVEYISEAKFNRNIEFYDLLWYNKTSGSVD